jgi:hypothetical protein
VRQRHHHCGQRCADRRRDPDRQRQDHHLQVGLCPGGGCGSGRIRRHGNIVTDGNGNSTVYIGTTADPTARCRIWRTPSTSPAASRRLSIAAGAATLSNSSGTNAAIAAGVLTLHTGTGADLSITGRADLLKSLGLTASVGSGDATVTRQRTHDCLARHAGSGRLDAERQRQDHHVQERRGSGGSERPTGSASSGNIVTDGNGNSTVYLQGGTIADTLKAIDLATGVQTATNASGTATVAVAPVRLLVHRCGRAADLDRHDRRSVDHRHRQRALGARPHRQHRTGPSFTAGRPRRLAVSPARP